MITQVLSSLFAGSNSLIEMNHYNDQTEGIRILAISIHYCKCVEKDCQSSGMK